MMMKAKLICTALLAGGFYMAQAQQTAKPEDTEVYTPVPPKVTPGKIEYKGAPSDAIILFDGKNLDAWKSVDNDGPALWTVGGSIVTV
jgi:hypothetical protein